MELNLEENVTVVVKVIKGNHSGKTIPLVTDLTTLIEDGLSMCLIEAGVFDHICHPCDYYEIVSVSV